MVEEREVETTGRRNEILKRRYSMHAEELTVLQITTSEII